jgi:hypothetical protein
MVSVHIKVCWIGTSGIIVDINETLSHETKSSRSFK